MPHIDWTTAIGTGTVVVGWIVIHSLQSKRDRKNKLTDVRTSHLLEVYRTLEQSCGRKIGDDGIPSSRKMEKAFGDIQVFGSLRQIELAKQYAMKLAKNEGLNWDELLDDLRMTLRSDLGLESISGSIWQFRSGNSAAGIPQVVYTKVI